MRGRDHALGVDGLVGRGHDLGRIAGGVEVEAAAAGAAHAERVPREGGLERVVAGEQHHEHLVRRRGVGRAAGGGDDGVGLGAVGDHGRVALQAEAGAVALDRRLAGADVAAALTLGGRGGDEHLFVGQLAQEGADPGAVHAVADHASDLHLVHGVDQRRGAASLAQRVTDLGELAQAGVFAAEALRRHDAHQPLGLRGGDRLGGEAAGAIDVVGELGRDGGHTSRAFKEIGGRGSVEFMKGHARLLRAGSLTVRLAQRSQRRPGLAARRPEFKTRANLEEANP